MFKKLRNKIILTNMLTTTAILAIAFVSIFAFATYGGRREMPRPGAQKLTLGDIITLFWASFI